MEKHFITTTSKETAELLLKENFKLVSKTSNSWTFLNDSKMVFSNLEKTAYTDKLTF